MANEKRLIDANALKIKIKLGAFGMYYDAYDVQVMPTVDAVEVVRCKDCTKWGGVPFGNVCRRWSAPLAGMKNCTGPDDFCSYGERRDKDAVD